MLPASKVREMLLACHYTNLANAKSAAAKSVNEPDPAKRHDFTDMIRNIAFLIHFYENGGDPPPMGGKRWVANGQFVDDPAYEVRGSWLTHFPDNGIQLQFGYLAGRLTTTMASTTCRSASPARHIGKGHDAES